MPQLTDKVAYQPHLTPAGPKIFAGKAFARYAEEFDRLDELLIKSGVESAFVAKRLAEAESQAANEGGLSGKRQEQCARNAVKALRCVLTGFLLHENPRHLHLRLAESEVLQRFCRLREMDRVKVPSKSSLQEYRNAVSAEELLELTAKLTVAGSSRENPLALVESVATRDVWIDCTCLKGNIHFPVDWILLRDAVRTIIKGILTMRRHGLRHRMPAPEQFLKQVNALCIRMHNARRKTDAAKFRKQALRELKKITQTVEKHGRRYIDLLTEQREVATDLSEKEAGLIIERIKNVLDKLPEARDQAHRRIIRGELVKNDEKILSLYDDSISIIKRGKASGEVEFGHELLLAEQQDGLIVYWQLYRDQPPGDAKKLPPLLPELAKVVPDLSSICTDRGFYSESNVALLEDTRISSRLCPKAPDQLREEMQKPAFAAAQKRRAQTEARVAIVKNCFIGNPAGSRVFEYRLRQTAWAILAHNLRVLARLAKIADSAPELVAA